MSGWAIPVLLGLLGLGPLTKFLFPKQAFFRVMRNLAFAVLGWLAAIVQLSVFDPWYLRRSRDYRIRTLAPSTEHQDTDALPGPSPHVKNRGEVR
jgi:hypothetical protein